MAWASLPRIICLSVAATIVTFVVTTNLGKNIDPPACFIGNQSRFQCFLAFSPSSVLGCSVTHPVWMYSMSCLKTSGSNSSMIRVWCWRWSPEEEEEAPEAEEEQEGCVRRM